VPDDTGGSTVVHADSRTFTLTKPGFMPSTGWDVSIAFLPLLTDDPVGARTYVPDQLVSLDGNGTISNPYDVGPQGLLRREDDAETAEGFAPGIIVICYAPTGSPLWVPGSASAYTTYANDGNVDYTKYLETGSGIRLAGASLKVENVTPTLSVTGTVTGCHMTRDDAVAFMEFMNEADTSDRQGHVLSYQAPPGSLSQLRLLGGVTLPAADGALMVAHLEGTQPMSIPTWSGYIARAQTGAAYTSPTTYSYGYYGSANLNPAGASENYAPRLAPLNFHGFVMHFSGLNDETVLSVMPDVYIEQRVQPNSPLITVAQPATPYNPRALQLADYVQKTLPPIVAAHENDIGDWFRKVGASILSGLKEIVPIAAPIVSALDPELAPFAMTAAQAFRKLPGQAKSNQAKAANKKKRK
jgi:hypothetical protein